MSAEKIIPERELNAMIDVASKAALHSNLALQAFRANYLNRVKAMVPLPFPEKDKALQELFDEEQALKEDNDAKQAKLEELNQYHWDHYLGPLYEMYSKMK